MTEQQLPDPMTPADCDLQDFGYMPLDVRRLRDSDLAAEQTPEENWAAVLLWAAAWHQVPAGSMPDKDDWIAKQAGYMARGRIDPGWTKVKQGAMRGFVLCDDGRWYHPVVAEKANESWTAKLKQRWRTECNRIKQHNARHHAEVPFPEFERWREAGCPAGHPLPVAGDKAPVSPPRPPAVTGDTPPVSPIHPPSVTSETAPREGKGREGKGEGRDCISLSSTSTTNEVVGGAAQSALLPPAPPPPFRGTNGAAIPPRATVPIAPDWKLPESWGEDAEALGFKPSEILHEAEKFRQYYVVGKGAGIRRSMKGWRQAWSNWLGKATERRTP